MSMIASYFDNGKFIKYVVADKNDQAKFDGADIRCITCGIALIPCHGQRHYFRAKAGLEHDAECKDDRYHIRKLIEEDLHKTETEQPLHGILATLSRSKATLS